MDDLVLFNECSIDDINVIGKKAAFLCELYSKGFTVPHGFIITGNLFVKFVEMMNLKERIAEILMSHQDREKKSVQVQQIVLNTPFPEDMAEFVYHSYKKINAQNEAYVALRVSSTSDYIEDSFFLNIKGKERLINGIKSCWASVFSPQNIDLKRFKPSVIVQQMINPGKSGYVYTVNPLTENPNELLILTVSGLGNAITLGQVLPSMYIVNKQTMQVTHSEMKEQHIQYGLSLQRERTEKIDLQEPVKNILDEYIIKELAKVATRVESRIDEPQQVSFAIDKHISILGSKTVDIQNFQKRFAQHYSRPQPQQPAQEQPTPQQPQQNQQPQPDPVIGDYRLEQPDQSYQLQPEEPQPSFHAEQQPFQPQPPHQQDPQPQQSYQPRPAEHHHAVHQQEFENPGQPQPEVVDERTQTDEQPQGFIQQEQQEPQSQPQQQQEEDDMLQFYEPDVHHGDTWQQPQAPEQPQPQQSFQPQQDQHVESQSQAQPEETKESFAQKHMPETQMLSKILFQGSVLAASCDAAITTALKKKYQSIFMKQPPMQFEALVNEITLKATVPYQNEIKAVHRLRNVFFDHGKELSAEEITMALSITKRFFDEF